GVITPEKDYSGGPFWLELTPHVHARITEAICNGYGARNRPGNKNGGRKPLPLRFSDGRYSTRGLIEKYGVTSHIVRHWIDTDVITPEKKTPDGDFRFHITAAVEQRIQAALARGTGPRSAPRPHSRPIAG